MGKIGNTIVAAIVLVTGLSLFMTGMAGVNATYGYPVGAGPFWVAEFEMNYTPSGHFSFQISCNNGTFDVYLVDGTNFQRFNDNQSYGYIGDFAREGVNGSVTISGNLTPGNYGIIVNPHQTSVVTFYDVERSSLSSSAGLEVPWGWIAAVVVAGAAGALATFLVMRTGKRKQ